MKTKIYLNILAAGMLAFMGSCASDENIDRNKGKETDNSSALPAAMGQTVEVLQL